MLCLTNVGIDFQAVPQPLRALRCVNLTLPERGVAVISGASGSGKTTLLRVLSGELSPSRGEMTVGGEKTSRWSRERRSGWRRCVAETARALPMKEHTVGENLLLSARTSGLGKKEAAAVTAEVLEALGLSELGRCFPEELSGEELRLAELGCALVRGSRCLLCDEPLSGLSEAARQTVLSLLLAAGRSRLVLLFSDEELLPEEKNVRHIRLEQGQIVSDDGEDAPDTGKETYHAPGKGLGGFLFKSGLTRNRLVGVRLIGAFAAVLLCSLMLGFLRTATADMEKREAELLSVYPIVLTKDSVPSGDLQSLGDWLSGRVMDTEVKYVYDTEPVIYASDTSDGAHRIESGGLWTELFAVGDELANQYDLTAGRYPTEYNEAVLLLDGEGRISARCLRALGLAEDTDVSALSQLELLRMNFRCVLPVELYVQGADQSWVYLGDEPEVLSTIVNRALPVQLVGILQPRTEEAKEANDGGVGYLSALTEYAQSTIRSSPLVAAQLADPTVDVTCSLPFDTAGVLRSDEAQQKALLLQYADSLSPKTTVIFYEHLTGETVKETEVSGRVHGYVNGLSGEALRTAFDTYVASRYSAATLEENLERFGYTGSGTLRSVLVYARSFSARNSAAMLLGSYSESVAYTDSASVLSSAGAELFGEQRAMYTMTKLCAFTFAAVLILFLMAAALRSRREEAAALCALGVSGRSTRLRMAAECLVLGLVGSAVGGVCALLIVKFTGGSYLDSLRDTLLTAAGGTAASFLAGILTAPKR